MFPHTFDECKSILGKRETLNLARNTKLQVRGTDYAVKLHDTDVVTFRASGELVLNTDGWLTMTSKQRINECLGWNALRSDRGKWLIHGEQFFDGIIVKDKMVVNPLPISEVEAAEAEKRRIDKDINGYIKVLKAAHKQWSGQLRNTGSVDVSGDCWLCRADGDCLAVHVAESYVFPTIVLRALRQAGYSNPEVVFRIEDISVRAVRKLLRDALYPAGFSTANGRHPAHAVTA